MALYQSTAVPEQSSVQGKNKKMGPGALGQDPTWFWVKSYSSPFKRGAAWVRVGTSSSKSSSENGRSSGMIGPGTNLFFPTAVGTSSVWPSNAPSSRPLSTGSSKSPESTTRFVMVSLLWLTKTIQ